MTGLLMYNKGRPKYQSLKLVDAVQVELGTLQYLIDRTIRNAALAKHRVPQKTQINQNGNLNRLRVPEDELSLNDWVILKSKDI